MNESIVQQRKMGKKKKEEVKHETRRHSQRASSRSLQSGHVWLRSSQFSKHFSWNLKKTSTSERKIASTPGTPHARMFTGRSQDTPIVSLEMRHANRTLFHGHAQQRHLQLDTPVPCHPPPHELDLAHEIRQRFHSLILVLTIVIIYRRDTGRSGPNQVGNE